MALTVSHRPYHKGPTLWHYVDDIDNNLNINEWLGN